MESIMQIILMQLIMQIILIEAKIQVLKTFLLKAYLKLLVLVRV